MKVLPKRIIVLDTETISVDKRFIYDVGYIIAERQTDGLYHAIEENQFIVDQIYYNEKLFKTAYYEQKRPLYVNLLRSRKAQIKKFGYITQIIAGDLRQNDIQAIFAYNSSFDKGAFDFTCDDFKVKNPFNDFEFYDLLAISNQFIHLKKEYIDFVIENNYINKSGFIITNAEKTFAFISGLEDFEEEHTSLADSRIELAILNKCIENGFDELLKYTKKNISATEKQLFTVLHNGKSFEFPYLTKRNEPSKNRVVLKE
jgi:hypothetical protein